jgi:enterochelin esterase family protein
MFMYARASKIVSFSVLFASLAPATRAGREAPAEPVECPRLAALLRAVEAKESGAADRFCQELKGKAPLIEPIPGEGGEFRVTYVWRAEEGTSRVVLFGGMPRGGAKELSRLGDTPIWYLTERLPRGARYSYSFYVKKGGTAAGKLQPDPWAARAYADDSVVELPGAKPQPWSERIAGVPQGKLEAFKVKSEQLKMDRAVTVYTPPGYDPKAEPVGLVIVFDGESSGGDLKGFNPIPGPVILDNLIAKKRIDPVVAVFVDSGATRDRDLGCYPPFAEFMARELIPWVRSHFRVTDDPSKTVVSGFSRGGLGAACCAWRHPELFGNVLAQSGAFWWHPDADQDRKLSPEKRQVAALGRDSGWLTRQFATSPPSRVRFYLEAGQFETNEGGGIRTETRRLRDVLEARGYHVTYSEHPGGHDFIVWRGTFADGLLALIGK